MNKQPDDCFPAATRCALCDGNAVYLARVPSPLLVNSDEFETLWHLHPPRHAEIMMRGQLVKIPRWQQAFGMDYRFSGIQSAALPVPAILQPFLDWVRAAIDPSLNGLLLNWYDASLAHYIGPHHDDTRQLVVGSPIVTISLGEERVFRLTRYEKQNGKTVVADTHDLEAAPGSVIVLPWATNLAWKHSVPHSTRYRGRRISITVRSFSANTP